MMLKVSADIQVRLPLTHDAMMRDLIVALSLSSAIDMSRVRTAVAQKRLL